jgi:hypothetical protein
VVLTAGILLSFNALPRSCPELDSAQTRAEIVEAFNSSDFVFLGKPVDLQSLPAWILELFAEEL